METERYMRWLEHQIARIRALEHSPEYSDYNRACADEMTRLYNAIITRWHRVARDGYPSALEVFVPYIV